MNVCIINHLFPPYQGGGAETVARGEAIAREEKGDRVVVITMKAFGDSSAKGKEIIGNMTIYRLSSFPGLFYGHLGKYQYFHRRIFFLTRFFPLITLGKVWIILRKEKIEEVRTHNVVGISFTLGRLLTWLHIPFIHRLHDIQLVTPSGVREVARTKDTPFERVYSALMRWCYGNPKEVVSPSRFLREWYRERGFFKQSSFITEENPPIVVVPHGGKRVRGRVLFVGSLETHKGVDVLMRAWNTLPSGCGFTLHIAGRGARQESLCEWASSKRNVSLLGYLSGAALQKEFEEASVFVFPSLCIENSPTAIREALAYGLPVVAVDTGGVRELLHIGSGSLLVPPNDAHAIGRSLVQILRA